MKRKKDDQDIKNNVKWFSKFSLEKRLELAFEQIQAIKVLKNSIIKKHAPTN